MTVNDYQEVLRVYTRPGGFNEEDDPEAAKLYLQKYWLSTAEYKQHSQALQASIFDMEKRLPGNAWKR